MFDIPLQTHRRQLSEREVYDDPEVSDDWNTACSPGSRANDSPSFHSKGSFSTSSPSKKFIVGEESTFY